MSVFSWLDSLRHARQQRSLRDQQAEQLGARAFEVLETRKNIPSAVSLFRRAQRLQSREARWHWGLGRCYLEQVRGRLIYLELDPQDLPWLVERYDLAMTCFREALRHDRCCVEAHYYRGQLLALRGLEEEACRAWEQVLTLEPTHEDACRSLAETCGRLAAERPTRPLF